jgi:Uri superfamily endonuclease
MAETVPLVVRRRGRPVLAHARARACFSGQVLVKDSGVSVLTEVARSRVDHRLHRHLQRQLRLSRQWWRHVDFARYECHLVGFAVADVPEMRLEKRLESQWLRLCRWPMGLQSVASV